MSGGYNAKGLVAEAMWGSPAFSPNSFIPWEFWRSFCNSLEAQVMILSHTRKSKWFYVNFVVMEYRNQVN